MREPVVYQNVEQACAVLDSICASPSLPSALYDWQKDAWYFICAHIKEGTPSASHNSESTQLKCVSCGSIVPSNTIQKHTGLCSLCNPPF